MLLESTLPVVVVVIIRLLQPIDWPCYNDVTRCRTFKQYNIRRTIRESSAKFVVKQERTGLKGAWCCYIPSVCALSWRTKIICFCRCRRLLTVENVECDPPTVRLIGNRQRVEQRSRKMRFEVFVPLRCPSYHLIHEWKVRRGQCKQHQYIGDDEDELVNDLTFLLFHCLSRMYGFSYMRPVIYMRVMYCRQSSSSLRWDRGIILLWSLKRLLTIWRL